MDVEIKEKENRRHVGRNLQRIRVYLGMKQEALAADLGVNQQVISKIEKQEEIEEGFLKRIAEVLGISEEVIKDFDVEKTIFNINHHNYKDANISEGATTYAIVQQINPLEKIFFTNCNIRIDTTHHSTLYFKHQGKQTHERKRGNEMKKYKIYFRINEYLMINDYEEIKGDLDSRVIAGKDEDDAISRLRESLERYMKGTETRSYDLEIGSVEER